MSDVLLGSRHVVAPAAEQVQAEGTATNESAPSSSVLGGNGETSAQGSLLDAGGKTHVIDTASAKVVQQDGQTFVVIPQESAASTAATGALTLQQAMLLSQIGAVPQNTSLQIAASAAAAAAAPLAVVVASGKPIYLDGRYVIPARAVTGEPLQLDEPMLASFGGELTLGDGDQRVVLLIADEIPGS